MVTTAASGEPNLMEHLGKVLGMATSMFSEGQGRDDKEDEGSSYLKALWQNFKLQETEAHLRASLAQGMPATASTDKPLLTHLRRFPLYADAQLIRTLVSRSPTDVQVWHVA